MSFSDLERALYDVLDRSLNKSGGDFDPERDIHSIMVNRWNYGYAHELTSVWDPSLFGPNRASRTCAAASRSATCRSPTATRARSPTPTARSARPTGRSATSPIDTFPYRYMMTPGTSGDDGRCVQRGGRAPAAGDPRCPRRRGAARERPGRARSASAAAGVQAPARAARGRRGRRARGGRQRLYRLNGLALKPIHDWVAGYERLWAERFDELDAVLEELKQRRRRCPVARATVTLPADEQILITREFDAPRHLVCKAWTTPELVRRWWSGRRGEMTVVEMDFRVGGAWRYV